MINYNLSPFLNSSDTNRKETKTKGSFRVMKSLFFSLLLCFFIFASAARDQVCSGGQTFQVIGFEDIQVVPYENIDLPQPYHNFVFSRAPSDWLNTYTPLMNTSGAPYFDAAPSSGTNVILTTNEAFILQQAASKGNRTFNLMSVSLTSIFYDNMPVYIEVSRNNLTLSRKVVTLNCGARVSVSIDSPYAGDKVVIACVNQSFSVCAHIGYDDFAICYKPVK